MIICDHEQGSEEWHLARLGIATASNFNRIMTNKQLKRSKDNYLYELAAEYLTKEAQVSFAGNSSTDRGNQLEPEAIAYYEFKNDCECRQVGLCLPFDGASYGCSPDALIGEDGGLECKAPELKTHLKYWVENIVPDEYLHQVYGCLYVTDREWWDFISYHPDFEPFIIRVSKTDESYQKWAESFSKILPEFLKELEKIKQTQQQGQYQ